MYSSLSYFSDISDHNSQVIELDKHIKLQTNDINNYDSELEGEQRTSQVNRNDTGSELVSHVTFINENNTVQTQRAELQRVFVNEKSVIREFGFIPGKIPKIMCTVKNQDIEFQNPSQWLRDMHKAVKSTNEPNYRAARIAVPSGLQIPAWRQLVKD